MGFVDGFDVWQLSGGDPWNFVDPFGLRKSVQESAAEVLRRMHDGDPGLVDYATNGAEAFARTLLPLAQGGAAVGDFVSFGGTEWVRNRLESQYGLAPISESGAYSATRSVVSTGSAGIAVLGVAAVGVGAARGAWGLWKNRTAVVAAARGSWGSIRGLFKVGAPKATGTVVGPYGEVPVQTLVNAAEGGGPTTTLFTRLSSAPEAGRALSTATEAGLANAVPTAGRTSLYSAQVPTRLLVELENVGLVQRSTTEMAGAVGQELRFSPQAAKFVLKFFK
jgi:hypothetical protein